MSRSFKQRFIEEFSHLLQSVSVTPQPGRTLVSHPLHEALLEVQAELARPRTSWHLVAALSGVKSHITTATDAAACGDPFWAQETVGDEVTVYGILDDLHHRAAMRAGVLPSGLTVFAGAGDGIRVQHGEVDTSASPASPTLRLIAEEQRRIEDECRT